jgi:N-acetylglutamate synthase-like GNAT family acetyltransferase
MNCSICEAFVKGNQGLSKHLKKYHNLSCEDYVIQHVYGGVAPTCGCGCDQKTKFRKAGSFDFPKFLRGHKTQDIKDKIEQGRLKTCLEKFGTTCSLQNSEVKQKTIETNLDKYGVEHYSQTKEYKEKLTNTTLERYGVEWYTQLQCHKDKHSNNLPWENITEYCKNKNYEPCFTKEEYVTNRTRLKFKCVEHNVVFESNVCNVQKLSGVQCPSCKSKGVSAAELKVADYVETFAEVKRNDKSIISPQELDIFVPAKKTAVEFDGLYWHSELHKPHNYHLDKFNACREAGVRLIQIYEDEWRDKPEVWKSILSVILGNKDKFSFYHARKLKIDEEPTAEEMKEFLNQCHLQGFTRSKKSFVLKDDSGEILFCLTMRQPFTKKPGVVEIARVCSKPFCLVRGGFSKLMKRAIEWAKESGYERVLTYSDCRFSLGDTYKNYGFEFLGHTGKGYGYTDFVNRFGRFKYRAQKPKTEKEVAKENNVHRLYNAGNFAWQYLL